jgi:hypothetical protein
MIKTTGEADPRCLTFIIADPIDLLYLYQKEEFLDLFYLDWLADPPDLPVLGGRVA